MKREILFRGKHKDGWVVGYYMGNKPEINVSLIGFTGMNTAYYVTPETVGQFTGLTDKNGKKIFEGDIIGLECGEEYDIIEFYSIIFMEGRFVGHRRLPDHNSIAIGEILVFLKELSGRIEVIGNIHDDPDMLI